MAEANAERGYSIIGPCGYQNLDLLQLAASRRPSGLAQRQRGRPAAGNIALTVMTPALCAGRSKQEPC